MGKGILAVSWPSWLYSVTPQSCISAAQDAGDMDGNRLYNLVVDLVD